MTNERASANDKTHPVEPVTYWENTAYKGHVFCTEDTFTEHVEETQALRDRQAAYLASLPANPAEAITAALRIMHHDAEEYPDGIEEALHLSVALRAMIDKGDTDPEGRTRDAALYIADRIGYAMHRATQQLDRMSDILRTPGRADREARYGA